MSNTMACQDQAIDQVKIQKMNLMECASNRTTLPVYGFTESARGTSAQNQHLTDGKTYISLSEQKLGITITPHDITRTPIESRLKNKP